MLNEVDYQGLFLQFIDYIVLDLEEFPSWGGEDDCVFAKSRVRSRIESWKMGSSFPTWMEGRHSTSKLGRAWSGASKSINFESSGVK